MAPFAEAGPRSFLFTGDIHVIKNVEKAVVTAEKQSTLDDLKRLCERPEPMTIISDITGTVYINEKETSEPVCIPKSATFEITGTT